MQHRAGQQVRCGKADCDTVFENRVTLANVLNSDFVSGRYNVTGDYVALG